ncbi:hypothetical protein [Pelagicoccus mobilis]|uniref:Uncharacterized protein n=1 Tax=Pelagicoccus mobilis TaxID=415221 RepID=A0A934VU04_9BACT|nr:hypothetical protein [Pelagicoccus mobilis]MBK1880610.1 hypothetical protein [Pelagicoccus mobilis]
MEAKPEAAAHGLDVMKEDEKENPFWKPFLLWIVLFALAQITCAAIAKTLIENQTLKISDQADPFRLSLAISTICLLVFSFVGILAGKKKPYIVASSLVTCGTSMNPFGTAISYLLVFGLAKLIQWAFMKIKLLVGYYKPM